MVLFKEMSGLKVNFHKSLLVRVNISDSCLVEAASILNCKVGHVPFLYLGLSIGGNPRRLAFWDSVLQTIAFCIPYVVNLASLNLASLE